MPFIAASIALVAEMRFSIACSHIACREATKFIAMIDPIIETADQRSLSVYSETFHSVDLQIETAIGMTQETPSCLSRRNMAIATSIELAQISFML